MRFKATRITHTKFVHSPFSSEQMARLGNLTLASVMARIKSGINCEDQPAKPLKPGKNGKPGYPEQKSKKGIAPIRNWISPVSWPRNRIKTLRALKVKSANENRCVIGFIDPTADTIAHKNNQQEKMFGLSPTDRKVVISTAYALMREGRLVRVQKVA